MDFSQYVDNVTLIIALCALISPIATALLNNRYQYKMKQLEYAHQDKVNQENRISEIYDGYIQAADACIHTMSEDALYDFARHSGLALRYVPDDLREKMVAFEKSFYSAYNVSHTTPQHIDDLNEIIVMLRQLKKLPY